MTQLQRSASRPDRTGLPASLRSGIEALSGMDMSGVRVHRNSDKPAALQAHAYAQGSDIHLGPGQEKHLPHEAWHVVQQAQGRVRPTVQMKDGVHVSDDASLELEADVMGAKADSLPFAQAQPDHRMARPARAEGTGSRPGSQRAVQRMSIQKGYRGAAAEPIENAPFQLATIQFEASYDLNLYKSHILAYIEETPVEKTPVIELRAYDSATPTSIAHYLDIAAGTIQSWDGTDRPFIVRYKTLRDETVDPHHSPADDVDGELATLRQIGSLSELKLDADKQPGFLQHNPELATPKAEIEAGNLMVPAPEFHELSDMGDAALRQIWMGQAQQKYSLHVRVLAKMILDSRVSASSSQAEDSQGGKEMPAKSGRMRRSNSVTRPAALTITNLVAGDEEMTRGVVLEAVQAAFAKQVQVVLLTVEHQGTGTDPWHRISSQITALRKAGFRADTIQTIAKGMGAKAQQSGLRKDEPTPSAPARSVLKITRETRPTLPAQVSRYIAEHQLVGAYLQWYAQMVHQDTDEAMDTIEVTGQQFLVETQGFI